MTNPSPMGAKVQPFWAPTTLTQSRVEKILATEVVTATLPGGHIKTLPKVELPMADLFDLAPIQHDGQDGIVFTPNIDQARRLCVVWCQALSRLPPKSLPRSQRPMIHILKKLTPEPTGVVAIDKGRNMLLDGVFENSLWVPITLTLVEKIAPPAA